jgi:hypothetical protein
MSTRGFDSPPTPSKDMSEAFEPTNNIFAQINKCMAQTCYIVWKHYIEHLSLTKHVNDNNITINQHAIDHTSALF